MVGVLSGARSPPDGHPLTDPPSRGAAVRRPAARVVPKRNGATPGQHSAGVKNGGKR